MTWTEIIGMVELKTRRQMFISIVGVPLYF